jgi:hypothetical protein
MTNKSSKLNKDDINYLLDILHDEEERRYADIEIRDNVDSKSQSRKTPTYQVGSDRP